MPLNLERYFDKIGIPKQIAIGLKPSIECLYFIVNKHVMAIPYQNFSLFFKEKAIDMSISGLEERLINQNQGGMCYENSELLYHALLSLGFDVRRVPAFVLNNKPFNPDFPPTHIVSMVLFEKRIFLIDVGFGYNSLRYPLELDLNQTQQEMSLFVNENYQLLNFENYLQLNVLQDNNWFSLYRLNKPFEFMDFNNAIKNYCSLINFNGCVPIRDLYIKAGVVTQYGRECFHFEPKKGTAPFAFRTTKIFEKEQTSYHNQFLDFKKDLISTLGIQPLLGSKKLIKYEALEEQPRALKNMKWLFSLRRSRHALSFAVGVGAGSLLYDTYLKVKPK